MSIASRINEMTEHLRNDWNSINKLGLKAKKLPDEYRQVEYIASSGTQYIDTGFVPNQNTRTVIDFMLTSAGSPFIFGSRLGYNNNAYDLYTFANKFRDDYVNTNYGNNTSENFPKVENKRYLFDKNKNHSIMYEENVQFYDHTFNGQTINLSFNMFLFGVNNNGSIASSNIAKMKLYSCKIYDNGILVRDFIPCYRINDVKVGLYDTINDVFYTNQGTGVFTYGEIQEGIPNKNIKNIAPVLNRFYNQASDKTDLAKNGVVGRTSQETTTGKNLFGFGITAINKTTTYRPNATQRLTLTAGSNINEVKFNYASGSYCNGYFEIANIDGTLDYTISFNIKENTTQFTPAAEIDTTNSTTDKLVVLVSGRNGSTKVTTSDYFILNNIQIEIGSTATSYEPYKGGRPSPSPGYPQEINNLSGDVEYKVRGKNLFDKDNANVLNAYFAQEKIIASSSAGKTLYISCKPNTTYTVSRIAGTRFRVLTTETTPTLNANGIDYQANDNTTSLTITTSNNANYLCVYYYSSASDTKTEQQILDTIQVEQNDHATAYEPYISESFPLSLKSRNLFDSNGKIIENFINNSGMTYTLDNGIYTLNGTNTQRYIYLRYNVELEPGSYIFTGCPKGGSFTGYSCIVRVGREPLFDYGDGISFTLTEKETVMVYPVRVGADSITVNDLQFKPMLEKVDNFIISKVSPYEPYYDINLCNISDYKDRIYSQNGKLYLEKKTGKVVLNGSENITQNYNQSMFRAPLDNFVHRIESPSNLGKSNYYACRKYSDMYDGTIGTGFEFGNQGADYIYIRNKDITSINDFKTWLSTHNTEVQYVLATSTTTEITQENYPTLYSQLLAIQEFLTKYKINKEFLLDYSSPEIEY